MRVLIAGCGYVGLALGSRLAGEGHHVTGLRRSSSAGPQLVAAGISPWIADFTQPNRLATGPTDWDWVVHCGAPSTGDEEAYRATYLEGTRQLLTWLQPRPPSAFLFTSSTSVYPQTDGSWVTEMSPTLPDSPNARILLETEDLLRTAAAAGVPTRILRVSGIYGPGRNRVEALERGPARPLADSERWMNMVHRDDLVEAIVLGCARGQSGATYNVSDDTPVKEREFLAWLTAQLGSDVLAAPETQPLRSARTSSDKRVDNATVRRELGWHLRYPSFREGYAPWIRAYKGVP